jgi:hypothetical protein
LWGFLAKTYNTSHTPGPKLLYTPKPQKTRNDRKGQII